ncbi:ATP-dependent DNA helicase RecG [Massiliimalia massiliensis]|uniref:ATP-dependent DNA helicase RecG n=1 Tax=Massiliimalia massiliensis TaxID=1852384 RepID=UPI000985496D|nr:ATP-dependent DNA helicase RecG [Massiliimalia massiliensis]
MPQLSDPIRYLKGVGERRAKCYEKLGVDTVCSLLRFFPRTYTDFSETKPIMECELGSVCCIRGRVFHKQGEQRIRKGLSLYKVFVTDGHSDMTVTIFNSRFQYEALQMDKEYCFRGKLQGNLIRREMNSPEFIDPEKNGMICAVYHLTEGLTNRVVSGHIRQALELWGDRLEDVLPEQMKQQEHLCHLRFAYENIHFPQDAHALSVAKYRLVFEELLTLQLGLGLLKSRHREETAVIAENCDISGFEAALPFTLTEGQKQAVADGLRDFRSGIPMNRLVQGDVGSGKTMVACGLGYCMAQNGYQTAVMAPTEILAVQHFKTFSDILEPMELRCALLTGSMSAKQKQAVREGIATGKYQIIVGTHALIQDTVSFARLGLVVTDEQHRFGVNQRAKLAEKGERPHRLVMSATPIPRTLALMIYGDLDLSVIKEAPKGRQPIKTYLISGKKRERAFGFIREYIGKGHQAYIVCPLIEEGETEAFSVTEYAQRLKRTVLSDIKIGVMHGKLKSAEKEELMGRFAAGEIDLLVSTTVVEVGVDVPNAAIMMIENAELFGLSQLHQLRGRVGRGSVQSHCILVSDNPNEQTRERLKIMTQSSDGFYISEQDLKQRGPGDFFGSRQHGLPQLKIANMVEDMETLKRSQRWAKKILSCDPELALEENRGLKTLVSELFERGTQENG